MTFLNSLSSLCNKIDSKEVLNMSNRIEKNVVFIDNIFHCLQDYENKIK